MIKKSDFMSAEEWLRHFSTRLRTLIENNNMSQYELSELSGISRSRLSEYINMKSIPTVFAIINLAYAFDVSTESLIDFGKRIEPRDRCFYGTR